MLTQWSKEAATEYVFKTMTEKENYFMARSKHLLARNLSAAITQFTAYPEIESKKKFHDFLEEIRKLKIADHFFTETVDPKKNAQFYNQVMRSEKSAEKVDLMKAHIDEKMVEKQIEAAKKMEAKRQAARDARK